MDKATIYMIAKMAGMAPDGADMTQYTNDQTLAAPTRACRGAVLHYSPQPDPWKPIGDLVGDLLTKTIEARQ